MVCIKLCPRCKQADSGFHDRIFYYPGAKYDNALLVQSFVMVVMQVLLLKIGLDHRPAPYSKAGDASVPFSRVNEAQRPFNFWQWKSPKPWVSLSR